MFKDLGHYCWGSSLCPTPVRYMAVGDLGQVIFSLHASGSRAKNGTNDSVNLTSLVRGLHTMCVTCLEEGLGCSQCSVNISNTKARVGFTLCAFVEEGREENIRNIHAVFGKVGNTEYFLRFFFMQAMQLLSTIIFFFLLRSQIFLVVT